MYEPIYIGLPGYGAFTNVTTVSSFEDSSYHCSGIRSSSIQESRSFISVNFKVIAGKLQKIRPVDRGNFITRGLFYHEGPGFETYYEPSGRRDRYPIFNVVISGKNEGGSYRNFFEFLRTDQGCRLVSVTLRGSSQVNFENKD